MEEKLLRVEYIHILNLNLDNAFLFASFRIIAPSYFEDITFSWIRVISYLEQIKRYTFTAGDKACNL